LYTNGFRVLRRIEQRIDDPAVDAAAGEFDGGTETYGPSSGDEYLRLRGVGHALIMLPVWMTMRRTTPGRRSMRAT
jgi:hypothetical protein